MKAFEITVTTASTSSFVRDAVAAVNEEICTAGRATAFNQREIKSYTKFAEERITECNKDFRDKMKIEVKEVKYNNE